MSGVILSLDLRMNQTGFVLPNHMLLQLSQLLPRETQGILACCNPVPPLVKQNLNQIHAIIYKAREVPLDSKRSCQVRFVYLTRNEINQLLQMQINESINEFVEEGGQLFCKA